MNNLEQLEEEARIEEIRIKKLMEEKAYLSSQNDQLLDLFKKQSEQLRKAEKLLGFIEELVTEQEEISFTHYQRNQLNALIKQKIVKYWKSNQVEEFTEW